MLLACGLLNAGNVSRIFGWAAAADPAARLCLNEWGVLEGSNWQGLVELAREMLALGAPLGCLGVQVRAGPRAAPHYPPPPPPRPPASPCQPLPTYGFRFRFTFPQPPRPRGSSPGGQVLELAHGEHTSHARAALRRAAPRTIPRRRT
jgi:hypothetical protein